MTWEITDYLTDTWRDEHLFNLGQAFKTLQFIDERIADYDMKASEMFAALAVISGNPPPPPPLSGTKLSDKERSNFEGKAAIFRILGFDPTTIPGIGYNTARIIVSELGTTFDNFPTERHFASYVNALDLCAAEHNPSYVKFPIM